MSLSVPNGVLTILPGFGQTTGKAIISNALIRKVDVTVSEALSYLNALRKMSIGGDPNWTSNGKHRWF